MVRIFKSDTGVPSVTWNDCVIESIRVGWIDGQMKPFDDMSYLQRLTRRKVNSNWSAKNCRHATTLIAEGRMLPAGLAQVEAAKSDGRWDTAYAVSHSGQMIGCAVPLVKQNRPSLHHFDPASPCSALGQTRQNSK
jgi:uncharacterized protein YdeI (YjbR/CyaY-like superfamily)